MRILLFGRDGRIGWELMRALAPLGEVVALDRDAADHQADFRHPDALVATVHDYAPDVIVNAAGYTAVDRAESEPALAQRINADAAAVLAREAAARGAWLVHYSTDYVFDDSRTDARDETAPARPLSAYGRSKLAGEQAIVQQGGRHLILRTGWIHAARGHHFARAILAQALARPTLRVVADQVGAPTGADLVADVTAHALRMVTAGRPELGGTYHLVAAGETSWHGYACHVIDRARSAGLPIKATPADVMPISSRQLAAPARRPLNSRLSTAKLRQAFGLHVPPWQAGVERMLLGLFETAAGATHNPGISS
jgi:dTDP-4-dehydrorhamnose reductase